MTKLAYQDIIVDRKKIIIKGLGRNHLSVLGFIILAIAISCSAVLSEALTVRLILFAVSLGILALVMAICRQNIRLEGWAKLYKQFAARNNLSYREVKDTTFLPFLPSDIGERHRIENVVSGDSFWAGTYVYEIKNIEMNATFHIHAMSAHINHKLPQMFFDGGNKTRRSGKVFSANQRVRIPELDKHYTTYIPEAYHSALASLLTSEIRDSLSALKGHYTIELLDQDIYISCWKSPKATAGQLELEIETLLSLKNAFNAIGEKYKLKADDTLHLQRNDNLNSLLL
jgi:hypothetical protein